MKLEDVYARRFPESETRAREEMWAEVARYLERYVPPGARVMDIACDRGELIRHIRAGEKWASDIRDVSANLSPEITFVQAAGLDLADSVPADSLDVVFMSNYLEHLRSSDDVVRQLEVAYGLLRRGGRVIVIQPNVRLVGGAYWDFIDHHVALTERSLVEAAEIAGFATVALVPRFLPYTTKSRLPQSGRLVRWYLRFPPAWRLLGKQTLYVGERA